MIRILVEEVANNESRRRRIEAFFGRFSLFAPFSSIWGTADVVAVAVVGASAL